MAKAEYENRGIAAYGGGTPIDANITLDELILTQHNVPVEGKFYYIKTMFYNSKSVESNRSQIAVGYNTNEVYQRYYYNGTWSEWKTISLESSRSDENIDNINKTDFRYTTDSQHGPCSENGYLFTQKRNDNFLIQEFTRYNGTRMYRRSKVEGTWGDWSLVDGSVEVSVDSLLVNSWTRHSSCQIYKEGHTVTINLCIKNGTKQNILVLPKEFRPAGTYYFPATTESNGTYVSITGGTGQLDVAAASVGKLIFTGFSYYVP